MNIRWNEVTWYSKLAALILLVVFVVAGFCFGFRYEVLMYSASNLQPASFISETSSVGFLAGQLSIGPVCPVERKESPCAPTPEMYAAHPILVFTDTGKPVYREVVASSDGSYRTELPVGKYIVDVRRSGIGAATGVPTRISIERGRTTPLDVLIDTGIR